MEILLQNIPIGFYTFLIAGFAFGSSYWIIPKLIGIIHYKNLMDDPNKRSSHTQQTPTLGGIAFFVSTIISIFFIKGYDASNISMNIIAGLTILFVIGLKDDLMILAPKTKIITQVAAITFILLSPELLPTNFYGFLGLSEIPLGLSIGFGYFIVLSIINAYNLIDGIDGLASMIGIVIFSVFAFAFYQLQLYYFTLLAVISIGFLAAFLRYNLSIKNKIFMGDTGSMIVGFLIGIMTLRFLALDTLQLQTIQIQPTNLLGITIAILFVPFIDTIRVFVIRILNKKGPFSPDRNHVHHLLIDFGLSHFKVSLMISLYNIFIFLLFFGLNNVISGKNLFAVLLFVSLFTVTTLFHINTNYSALKQKIKIRNFFIPKNKSASTFKLKKSLEGVFRIFF